MTETYKLVENTVLEFVKDRKIFISLNVTQAIDEKSSATHNAIKRLVNDVWQNGIMEGYDRMILHFHQMDGFAYIYYPEGDPLDFDYNSLVAGPTYSEIKSCDKKVCCKTLYRNEEGREFTYQDIIDKYKRIVADQFAVDYDILNLDTQFIASPLNGDSLDFVEQIMDAEDEFGISIPDDDVINVKTIGDAVKYIASKLEIVNTDSKVQNIDFDYKDSHESYLLYPDARNRIWVKKRLLMDLGVVSGQKVGVLVKSGRVVITKKLGNHNYEYTVDKSMNIAIPKRVFDEAGIQNYPLKAVTEYEPHNSYEITLLDFNS